MRSSPSAILFVLVFALTETVEARPQKSIEQCRQLNHKIEKLTQLRRQGGSSADMNSWKRQRRDLEKDYRDSRCKAWGYRL
jgi:hypothetical protein